MPVPNKIGKASEIQPQGYDAPAPFYKRVLRFLFGHVGMFILVACFACIGAWVYIQIELPAEERRYTLKRIRAADINDAANYMSSLFWHYQDKNLTFMQWDHHVKDNLKTMEQFIISAVESYKYDGTVDDWQYDWTYPKALLFTITIMTTIGYGHIAPATFSGQIFTIIYALIGTPLLLVFLANVGDTMATAFTYTYSRICCRWCRSRRYQSEAGFGKRVKRLTDDAVGQEAYMPTEQVAVPITINMILLMVYLMMGAILFSTWEGWDLGSSCYFSFVTLSTIGFGDMVPGNSFLHYKAGGSAAFEMIVTVLYCVFGMALISMCINMMQDQLVVKVRWFASEVGIIDSAQKHARPRVKYRRSRKEDIPETAQDDDGNQLTQSMHEKKLKKKRRKQKKEEKRAARMAEKAESESALVPAGVEEQSSKVDNTDRIIDEEMGQA